MYIYLQIQSILVLISLNSIQFSDLISIKLLLTSGPHDRVMCYACGITLDNWTEEQEPGARHAAAATAASVLCTASADLIQRDSGIGSTIQQHISSNIEQSEWVYIYISFPYLSISNGILK